jgi:hypothetical protein
MMLRRILPLTILFALLAHPAWAALGFVNEWNNHIVGQTSTGLPINTSTTTQPIVGDVFVAVIDAYNTNITISPPAGWSPAVTQWNSDASLIHAVVYYKVVTAPDIGATFTFTTGGVSSYLSGGIIALSGNDPSTPILTAGTGDVGSTSLPRLQGSHQERITGFSGLG